MRGIQEDLFGNERRIGQYLIFHDESGNNPGQTKYLAHGFLFIRSDKFYQLAGELKALRRGVQSRIHAQRLKEGSGETAVAKRWLKEYFHSWFDFAPFYCLLVDMKEAEKQRQFRRHEHLYNYSVGLGIWSAVNWFLADYDEVNLTVVSDHFERANREFHRGIPNWISAKARTKRLFRDHPCPEIKIAGSEFLTVPSDLKRVPADQINYVDFLQLCDVLVSSVGFAVRADAERNVKIEFGAALAEAVKDIQRKPWEQNRGMHRKFSVSGWPTSSGSFFDCPITIVKKFQDDISGLKL